jgi:predicted amidophosphoribosyltransferase
MKQRIHREDLLFQWITKDHEIVMGFKRVKHGICESCGRRIPQGETLCDTCFKEKKKMSKK